MDMQSMHQDQEQGPGESQGQSGAAQLLVNINDNLNQLGQLIGQSQLPPQDKKNFANLMQNFMQFADSLGAPASGPKPVGGNVPYETMGKDARQAF